MFAASLMGIAVWAASVPPPAVPRILGQWRIGIWAERRGDADSATTRRWAESLVEDFSRRLAPTASAKLERFVLLAPGALPLAGGDGRHHPDLRATDLDAAWGVLAQDSLSQGTLQRAERAWLAARGCPDERNFGVGWDLFQLPADPYNKPDTAYWRRDERNYVMFPRWSMLPDSGLNQACRQILYTRREAGLELFSVQKLPRGLREALPPRLAVGVLDEGNRPAAGAVLEIWRGKPDARRPFANRLEGRPDTFVSDTTGRFPVRSGLAWLTRDSLEFGIAGANVTSYWRMRYGRKKLEGWMDAVDLADLPRREGWAELYWRLPGGSSGAWREASEMWPKPWVAAEADTTGTLTLGLSVPVETDYVLRVLDSRGRELARTRPIHLARGVHEKSLKLSVPPGWWDVRLDNPVDRFQLRVRFPGTRDQMGVTSGK
ncbi:MAG: hypothetical protein AAB214_04125 [Fibrobacterota bacterium]